MKNIKKIMIILILMTISILGIVGNSLGEDAKTVKPTVSYRTHVQDIGWQNYVEEGNTAGTEGKSARLEGIDIKLEKNNRNIGIKYQVHIQDIGWQDWKQDGELAGTTNQSKRLEAIKIRLENTEEYSIMYRVHVQDLGWQEWKKDGELAGTTNQSKRLEAIQIKIVEKQKVAKIYIDTPVNGNTYYGVEMSKLTVSGWKMSNDTNATMKAYIDGNAVDANTISYSEREDVINTISGYGTKEQNPTPGFKFDIDISKMTNGNHIIKIEVYSGGNLLAQSILDFNVDNSGIHVEYQSHVQDIGWQDWKKDGELAGTTNKSKRVEAIKIKMKGVSNDIHIKYQAHVQDIGWQDWKKDGELAGTTGQDKRIEAIRMSLENTEEYSIMYRVHVQDIGWKDWKKDGELAGTTGQDKRIEAIEIKIQERQKAAKLYIDTPINESTHYGIEEKSLNVSGWKMANVSNTSLKAYIDGNAIDTNSISYVERADVINGVEGYGTEKENPKPGFAFNIDISKMTAGKHILKIEAYSNMTLLAENTINFNIDNNIHIEYQAHIQDIGWQDWKQEGDLAGTTGQDKRIEAVKFKIINASNQMHVKYRAHIQDIGWQEWKQDEELAGTTGQDKRIEAIQIKLEGIEGYVIEYRSHVQNIGWQQWASDEMISGTVKQKLRIEAINTRIVKSTETVVPQIKYANYTTQNNWTSYVSNGQISGNDSSGINIEALKIALSKVSGDAKVEYKVHVQNIGWQDYVSNDTQAGVTGQNNAIEAIKIKLENLPGYSVEYRVYVNGKGWQDWVRDGVTSGTVGESKQIGAIQIRINIDAYPHNKSDYDNINVSKYPGYKELLDNLQDKHPTWSFKLLYTGLDFNTAVRSEYSVHNKNLVPSNYSGEWVCSVCGTKQYDSGWYGASEKAIAYYMDVRNFLKEENVYQFLELNEYPSDSVSISGIQSKVNGTFLQNYATAVNNACVNTNVNPYYIITRLLQEQGNNGTEIGTGMDGKDGKIYYNPFNIGASGDGYETIKANALATAKRYGWDTMQKAIEGGISFCKRYYLENYQNTLYLNKFNIDSRSSNALYTHQYMQNLMAASSESLTLRSMYVNTDKTESEFTFIIPVYENMSQTISERPQNSQESNIINVKITANGGLNLRTDASENSSVIKTIGTGEVVLSIQRGINSNWQKIVLSDGTVGYMSGTYLQQVSDVTNCNYTAYVKTADEIGCKIRLGPGIKLDLITALPDGTNVTVIDDSTYKNIDGYNWARIILSDGRQAFIPLNFLRRR